MNHRTLGALFGLLLGVIRVSAAGSAAADQGADTLRVFPFQDSSDIRNASVVALGGDSILMFFRYYDALEDSAIYVTTSANGGLSWDPPEAVTYDGSYRRDIHATKLPSGQILAVWTAIDGLRQAHYSAATRTWSDERQVGATDGIHLRLHRISDSSYWLTYYHTSENWAMETPDGGVSWTLPRALPVGTDLNDIALVPAGNEIIMFHSSLWSAKGGIVRSESNDNGQTWTAGDTVILYGVSSLAPWPLRGNDSALWMLFEVRQYSHNTATQWGSPPTQGDVWCARSTDDGVNWSDATRITRYTGGDTPCGADLVHGVPFFLMTSDRWANRMYRTRLWYGLAGSVGEGSLPPALNWSTNALRYSVLDVKAWISDDAGIADATVIPMVNDIVLPEVHMYDDGLHNDDAAGDYVFGARVDSVFAFERISTGFRLVDVEGNIVTLRPAAGGYYGAAHDTGNVALCLDGDGVLGGSWPPRAQWPKNGGQQYLSRAALWFGGEADGLVYSFSNDYLSSDGTWSNVPTVPRVLPSGKADQEFILSYSSSGNQLTVRQHSYQWHAAGRDDFIIFTYDIFNKAEAGGAVFSHAYAGLWADPDVTLETSANDDVGGVDEPRHMAYLQDGQQNPPGIFAVALLSHEHSGLVFYNIGEDPATALDHYGYLSIVGIRPSGIPADYRFVVSAGPFTLAPGESCTVTFGIVLGGTLAELQANADTMRGLYASVIADVGGNPRGEAAPSVCALEQNYPNPFNPTTTIRYALPRTSSVTLTVYNVLGQRVAELVNDRLDAGYHRVEFEARGLASGVYFYRLEAGEFRDTKKLLLVQ